ncbi:hypothetical protein RU639_007944 [Aspergillus parasiticus]
MKERKGEDLYGEIDALFGLHGAWEQSLPINPADRKCGLHPHCQRTDGTLSHILSVFERLRGKQSDLPTAYIDMFMTVTIIT